MRHGVIFEPFSERHFVRSFAKKYRGAWDKTRNSLVLEFTFMPLLFDKNIAETITDVDGIKICKTEFKIAGTQESRRSSGNRCIVAVHSDSAEVHVLLVYCKTDVRGSRETDWWKMLIRDNYPQYRNLV